MFTHTSMFTRTSWSLIRAPEAAAWRYYGPRRPSNSISIVCNSRSRTGVS